MAVMSAMAKETRSIRIDPQLWEDIGRLGDALDRTRSNLIAVAVKEFIERNRDALITKT